MEDNLDELANKVIRWAYARRIIQESSAKDQYMKAASEMGELADALLKNNREDAVDAFGDVLVCLINAGEIMGISMKEALSSAYDEIKDRRGVMFNNCFVRSTDPNYSRILKSLGIEEEGHE